MNTRQLSPVRAITPATSLMSVRSGLLQRKCACGGMPGPSGECAECRKKREGILQRRASGLKSDNVPANVHEVLRLPGQPLEPATRASMKPRFVHDFSQVRVHADAKAGELAKRGDPGNRIGALKPSLSGRSSESKFFDITTGASPTTGLKWTADMEIVHHSFRQKAAILSDSGETGMPDTEGDSILKVAQGDAFVPAPAPGVFPPSPPPPVPATPTCTYSITYANITKPGCSGGRCGAQIVYDVTKVTATGGGCPAKLEGLKLTESVTTDEGCTPGAVTTGAGCDIGAGGNISGCTDTYGLCASAASFPAAGCTEKYTQKLFVGGVLAETRTITFRITKSGGTCSGTVTRT